MNESNDNINTNLFYVINNNELPNDDCSGYVYLALLLLMANEITVHYCLKYFHISNTMNLLQRLCNHNSISLIKNNPDPYIDSLYCIIGYIGRFNRDKGLMLYIEKKWKDLKTKLLKNMVEDAIALAISGRELLDNNLAINAKLFLKTYKR